MSSTVLEYPAKLLQRCPLCREPQPMFIRGMVKNPETGEIGISEDIGYSFCNCRNIFYTDWRNIDCRLYDDEYVRRYEGVDRYMVRYAEAYFPVLKKLKNVSTFLEIGPANPTLLNLADKEGWLVTGVDIAPHEHPAIIQDNFEAHVRTIQDEVLDVVWASHVFEHFKDPLEVAEEIHRTLTPNGLLFVAMPDPYFIPWPHAHNWHHWWVREHHILWDMDGFIAELSKIGFRCVFSHRNFGEGFICGGDYHLVFQR